MVLWGKVFRSKGLRERLTFHVFLQLGKIIGAYEAPLLSHLFFFPKDGHKGSLVVVLSVPAPPLPRVGLEDDKSMGLKSQQSLFGSVYSVNSPLPLLLLFFPFL